MIVRKCDRCGKTIGGLETYAIVDWSMYRYGKDGSTTRTVDLCSRCQIDFLTFLSAKITEDKDHE